MNRPCRSALYLPASNARALAKAQTLAADVLIFDLEDAVAPDAKAAARTAACQAVRSGLYGPRTLMVRINPPGTEAYEADLEAVAEGRPEIVLLPKVSHPGDMRRTAESLAQAPTRLWIMIETPQAVVGLPAILENAQASRLDGCVLGLNDLSKDTGTRLLPGRAAFIPWIMTCVLAARAQGLLILDGVYNTLDDADGLRAECRQSRDMGFDGKTLIHPSQIAICNEAFTPDAGEVAFARKVVAFFDDPRHREIGVARLDGQMVERLHVAMARRVLAAAG